VLIAEDLLLLLTDDTTGALSSSGMRVDPALAGALLVELAARGRVDLTGETEGRRPGRIVVRDPSPTGDDLLDGALAQLGERAGSKPRNVLGPLAKGLRARLYARLVDRGILRAEQRRVLGLFTVHRWPTREGRHEQALRADLRAVLLDGRDPDERCGALVGLLHAARALRVAVDAREHGRSRRDVEQRAKVIAEGSWGSAAVRKALDETAAAVTAAIVAATSASGASG